MGRIIAIDYGKKRVGIAVTDPGKIIATALDTVSSNEIIPFLTDYISKEEVEKIVVGYPKQMNNEPSEAVVYIDPFLKSIQRKFKNITIEKFDERFTSKMAFQAILDAGIKKKKRQDKKLIDKVSAVIILQSYLENINNNLSL